MYTYWWLSVRIPFYSFSLWRWEDTWLFLIFTFLSLHCVVSLLFRIFLRVSDWHWWCWKLTVVRQKTDSGDVDNWHWWCWCWKLTLVMLKTDSSGDVENWQWWCWQLTVVMLKSDSGDVICSATSRRRGRNRCGSLSCRTCLQRGWCRPTGSLWRPCWKSARPRSGLLFLCVFVCVWGGGVCGWVGAFMVCTCVRAIVCIHICVRVCAHAHVLSMFMWKSLCIMHMCKHVTVIVVLWPALSTACMLRFTVFTQPHLWPVQTRLCSAYIPRSQYLPSFNRQRRCWWRRWGRRQWSWATGKGSWPGWRRTPLLPVSVTCWSASGPTACRPRR